MSSEDDLILRPGQDHQVDALSFCSLSNALYARKVDPAYYSWQFFQTPFPTFLLMALAGTDLAGSEALQLRDLAPSAGTSAWVVDIMLSPSFQGRGLFRRMSAAGADLLGKHQPGLICVMANARASEAYTRGLGWQLVNRLATYTRTTSQLPSPVHGLSLRPCADFASLAEVLPAAHAQMFREGKLVATRRSVEYLNWRFVSNPRYSYHRFLVARGSTTLGYVVLKVFQSPLGGQPVGDIVDLLWVDPSPGILRGILGLALDYFAHLGVEQAGLWLQTNTVLDSVGEELGFVPSDDRRYFCVKILDSRLEGLGSATSWFLSMSDSEVY